MKAVFLLFMFLLPVLTDGSFLQWAQHYAELQNETGRRAWGMVPWPVGLGYPGGLPLAAHRPAPSTWLCLKQYAGTVRVGIKLSLINKFLPGPQSVRHQDVIKPSHILKLLKS